MKVYTQEYIGSCRTKIGADVKAYRRVAAKVAGPEFEHRFFNNEVLVLQYMSEHRLSGAERRDGNPLNEIRVICNSIHFYMEENYRWPGFPAGGTPPCLD